MKTVTLISTIFLVIITGSISGQTITASKIADLSDCMFAEIAWMDDDFTCIITDRATTKEVYTHKINFYNKAGELIDDKIKVSSRHSIQHEYSFVINHFIYFLNFNRNKTGRILLNATAILHDGGKIKEEEFDIFNVSYGDELKRLHSEKYKFNVIKGVHGTKALITYNNDYMDPYREGFWFRTLGDKGSLSALDTFSLPYSDRLSNFNQIVYDDIQNKIIVLGDVFTMEKKERVFLKNIIGVYDINTGKYTESDVTGEQFYQYNTNIYIDDRKICIGGFKVSDSKEKTPVIFSYYETDPDNVTAQRHFNGILNKTETEKFYKLFNYKAKELLRVAATENDSLGNLHMIWNYYPEMDDVIGEGALDVLAGLGLGLIGAQIVVPLNAESPDGSSGALWLTIPEKGNQADAKMLMDTSSSTIYSSHGFSPVILNGELNIIYNQQLKTQSLWTQPFLIKESDNKLIDNKNFTKSLKEQRVNFVYPHTKYFFNNCYYYLGYYSFSCDPYGDNPDTKSAYYLLKLQNE